MSAPGAWDKPLKRCRLLSRVTVQALRRHPPSPSLALLTVRCFSPLCSSHMEQKGLSVMCPTAAAGPIDKWGGFWLWLTASAGGSSDQQPRDHRGKAESQAASPTCYIEKCIWPSSPGDLSSKVCCVGTCMEDR